MKSVNWKRIVVSSLGAVCLFHLLMAIFLYFEQEKMLFPGSKLPGNYQYQFDVPFEELNLSVSGTTLNALHFTQENPRGLVFFLHGNSGNLASWATGADYYQRVNYDMFIFDYRGYGKSGGKIESQQQLHDDVRAAWDFISSQYQGKPIVIYGRSLGTGLAVELARQVKADLLVLVSPYISMLHMAKRRFPLIPSFILRYPLRTDKVIHDIKIPTAFFHGEEDTLIPKSHSKELQTLMSIDAKLFIVNDAGHNDIHHFDDYTDNLTKLLPN